jgi:hypothetical protein
MSVSFFEKSCSNSDHCDCSIPCLENITAEKFGISDFLGGSGKPAKVLFSSPEEWDLEVNNISGVGISFKAIDWCIGIYRTGNYLLSDENRLAINFSSGSSGLELIKRCEGFLYYDSKIQFVEIKRNKTRPSNWIKDAREKFEETILSFREHHPDLAHQIVKPILVNRNRNKVNFISSDIEQQRILKDKVGLTYFRTTSIEV